MDTYYTEQMYDTYLMHYGVPGMKWGVKKSKLKTMSRLERKQAKYNYKNQMKANRQAYRNRKKKASERYNEKTKEYYSKSWENDQNYQDKKRKSDRSYEMLSSTEMGKSIASFSKPYTDARLKSGHEKVQKELDKKYGDTVDKATKQYQNSVSKAKSRYKQNKQAIKSGKKVAKY